MSIYTVTLYVSLDKSFDIEADSEDEAITKAERLMEKQVVGQGFTVDDLEVEGGGEEDEDEGDGE